MPKKKNYNDGTTINTTAYSWALVIYEIDKQRLLDRLKLLEKNGIVKHYAFIIHNNDKQPNEQGELVDKPSHAHLLLVLNQRASVKQLKERIIEYTEHNMFGQPIKDIYKVYRYLVHADDLDKFQYNEKDIIHNDDYFSKSRKTLNPDSEYNKIAQMIDDYANHIGFREMAIKYGRDFIINYKAYSYYFDLVIMEENKK